MSVGESVGNGAVRSQGSLARPPRTPVTSAVDTEKDGKKRIMTEMWQIYE